LKNKFFKFAIKERNNHKMEKFKVGIIGCGNIYRMHAQSLKLLDNAEIIAVCDIKEDRAKKAAQTYSCAYYTDYKKMIGEAGVVHICVPHYLHAEMAIYAMNAGKHVLTEKPMAIEYHDAADMVEATKKDNVALGVIFQNHDNAGSTLIKENLVSGATGKPQCARAIVTWDRSDAYYKNSDWKGTWDQEGGGVIIDQAIHTLDLLRWFLDSDIDYVDAHISNRAHDIIEVEDSAEGVIKFKNGVAAGFYCINYYAYDAPVEIEIKCEDGIARMRDDGAVIEFNDGRILRRERDPGDYMDYGDGAKGYWGTSHIKQITNYYAALASGAKPEIDGEYALQTQRMIAAIYNSGKLSKRIYFK